MTPGAPVRVARQAKHRAFVAYKRLRYPLSVRLEPWHRWWFSRRPYAYDASDFAAIGLGEVVREAPVRRDSVARVVYCFWTGENDLTPNRRANLDRLRKVNEPNGVQVVLVTPDTLHGFITPDRPLHPRYAQLHVVHRSDYLRAYFLHHFGGGYADIKAPTHHWADAFERFNASPLWLSGDHKPSRYLTPGFSSRRLERLMRRTSPVQVFQCALIARPRSPLTNEWWARLNLTLDAAHELSTDPGTDRFGGPCYPLQWTDLLGKIIDPLCVKYADHVGHDSDLRLSQSDYL